VSTAQVGSCALCGQELILDGDDCWHPYTVAVACPPEPPSSDFVAYQAWRAAGNQSLRPGREHFIPRPGPVITPGATPFTMCVCAVCGPPWRDERPRPDQETHPAGWLAWGSYMALCPTCGNKRCPAAGDHALECSGSNSPDQPHLIGRT
jgi:hypothetical protein